MTPDELKAWQPPYQPYIISNGILVVGTKMVIYGKFATWKSMLALHLAYCISNGKPWFGYKTVKMPVYLLQSEIPQAQVRERLMSYESGNGMTSNNMWISTELYMKLDKGFGIAELDKELSRTGAKVLIIDPLYKVVSGKLTDEWDMMQFMDRIDLQIQRYNVAPVILHHPRKDPKIIPEGGFSNSSGDDLFGSYLQNWADTIIKTETTDTDGELYLTFEKLRHSHDILQGSKLMVNIDRSTLKFTSKGVLEMQEY